MADEDKNTLEVINQINQLSKKAAIAVTDKIKTLQLEADGIQKYCGLLNSLFHLTVTTGTRYMIAAEASDDPKLKAYFMEEADEEEGHHLIAQKDMQNLGQTINPEPPESVQRINIRWGQLVERGPFCCLGGRLVIENIMRNVDLKEVIALKTRLNLKDDQIKFIAFHHTADQEHGHVAFEFAKAYIQDHTSLIVDGATEIGSCWTDVMISSLD